MNTCIPSDPGNTRIPRMVKRCLRYLGACCHWYSERDACRQRWLVERCFCLFTMDSFWWIQRGRSRVRYARWGVERCYCPLGVRAVRLAAGRGIWLQCNDYRPWYTSRRLCRHDYCSNIAGYGLSRENMSQGCRRRQQHERIREKSHLRVAKLTGITYTVDTWKCRKRYERKTNENCYL